MVRLTIIILFGLIVILFVSWPESHAQNRDRFLHSSPAHKKKDCNSCHLMPTGNSMAVRGFPDVAEFPGHAACASCHSGREQITKNFCAACHSSIAPARAPRFPFPVRSRSHEFSTIFPHNVHQDVIAETPRRDGVAVGHYFVKTSFVQTLDDPPKFNNCAICHQTAKILSKTAPRVTGAAVAGAADPFTAQASFFKDTPTGHASCFACHYMGIRPAANNCAGCHSLTTPYSPSAVLKRYSFKFDHNSKSHAVRDCMTCHIRIAGNGDLKAMKDADVPILACTSCHNHSDDLAKELTARATTVEAKQAVFSCNYCHTSPIARLPVPPSHEIK